MAVAETTALALSSRPAAGSRANRRLRREGLVPGVVYGAGDAPQSFAVDARILRNTLAHAHAVLEIAFDGGRPSPVIVKDIQRHPVRGEVVHLDLLRVRMDQAIQTSVALELVGADEAPGVVQGGILAQEALQVTIEALPGDIPDSIVHDVSGLELNATVTLNEITAPAGVTFVDDGEETIVATITQPTQEPTEDEIETETEVVGQAATDSSAADAQGDGATADEAS